MRIWSGSLVGAEAEASAWRALARPDDLEVDLGAAQGTRRASIVTRVLATCREDAAAGATGIEDREREAWGLTLAGRIGGLAAILVLTQESAQLPLLLECPTCGEPLELGLPLDAVLALARRAESEPVVELALGDGIPRRMRRPTGADQRRWHDRQYDCMDDAERALLGSLLETPAGVPEPNADTVLRIEEAMEEQDPLTCFRVSSRCISCETATQYELDLEALLLDRLERRQRMLLREVHRLATHYGWTETDVLSLPAWHRRAYLSMIAEGVP